MDLPLGLSFSLKLNSTFTVTLPLPDSTYCFCLGILFTLSLSWLLLHRYHWISRGVATSLFMSFDVYLRVIISIDWLNHFVDIPLHVSFYLQSRLAIIALLALDPLSLMLFTPPNSVPCLLISYLIVHLLSTVRLIGSNLMPPVPKFRNFLMIMTPFMGSAITLMVVFPLFVVIQ